MYREGLVNRRIFLFQLKSLQEILDTRALRKQTGRSGGRTERKRKQVWQMAKGTPKPAEDGPCRT